ncbi:MAG: putative toxin-antitoxin system toxin component, PIN family [Prevotella sp.]|nr:putative toxin-antitoxin system toxin component, PIN family [Prevotella sp.]
MKNDYGHIRVVIDTNLCISMLIGKRVKQLRQIFVMSRYELAISDRLIDEILRVTARPKFARYFDADDVHGFVQFLEEYSTKFRIDNIPQRCRDPKDDFLLELAVVADADILLSGDADLTDMKQIGHCKIMTVAEFIQEHGTTER